MNKIPCLKQDILPALTNEKRIPLLHWAEIAMHSLWNRSKYKWFNNGHSLTQPMRQHAKKHSCIFILQKWLKCTTSTHSNLKLSTRIQICVLCYCDVTKYAHVCSHPIKTRCCVVSLSVCEHKDIPWLLRRVIHNFKSTTVLVNTKMRISVYKLCVVITCGTHINTPSWYLQDPRVYSVIPWAWLRCHGTHMSKMSRNTYLKTSKIIILHVPTLLWKIILKLYVPSFTNSTAVTT